MFHFHLLGLAHLPTRAEYTSCAYTGKILRLARMLMGLGHHVTFYGVEGSQVECSEFVPVLSEAERVATFGTYNWHKEFFREGQKDDAAHRIFNLNAVCGIQARRQREDFLLCPYGHWQQPIAEMLGMMSVEPGIGYTGVFSERRVFESYSWMHHVYGRLGADVGGWYDAVIPNYFDVSEYPYRETKGDYYLYMGRIIENKGVQIAVEVTKKLGGQLIIAGQRGAGETGALHIDEDHVKDMGFVGAEKRARLLGGARAVFVPTMYIEPFGGVAVEAQLCGTPVITTDWGAFAETVVHGVTGYRCRTFEEFEWAARNADKLKPADCRQWAEQNYGMARVSQQYQAYFERLATLWGAGWYSTNPGRTGLDSLKRYYPERA